MAEHLTSNQEAVSSSLTLGDVIFCCFVEIFLLLPLTVSSRFCFLSSTSFLQLGLCHLLCTVLALGLVTVATQNHTN